MLDDWKDLFGGIFDFDNSGDTSPAETIGGILLTLIIVVILGVFMVLEYDLLKAVFPNDPLIFYGGLIMFSVGIPLWLVQLRRRKMGGTRRSIALIMLGFSACAAIFAALVKLYFGENTLIASVPNIGSYATFGIAIIFTANLLAAIAFEVFNEQVLADIVEGREMDKIYRNARKRVRVKMAEKTETWAEQEAARRFGQVTDRMNTPKNDSKKTFSGSNGHKEIREPRPEREVDFPPARR